MHTARSWQPGLAPITARERQRTLAEQYIGAVESQNILNWRGPARTIQEVQLLALQGPAQASHPVWRALSRSFQEPCVSVSSFSSRDLGALVT